MEKKQQKCERIAKEMRQDFLDDGIPEEQHVMAVALILSYLEDIKKELTTMREGIKRGVADCKAGRMYDWEDVKKEFGIK